jgi:hypothetical protein
MVYEGGCRCGAVRYRITGEPLSAGYCHCRMCQSAARAPVVAWVAFRRDDVHFVHGTPETVRSQARAVRRTCRYCGAALTFEYSPQTETVDVMISTLDDPNASEPVFRIWSAPRLPWRHAELPDAMAWPQ